MAGIDTIIAQIMSDTDASCAEILSKAKAEASDIIAVAQADAGARDAEVKKTLDTVRERKDRSIKSSADLKRRQAILNAKYDIIQEVLDKAYRTVLAMPEDEYAEFLIGLLKANVRKGDAVMQLSSGDLAKISDKWKKAFAAAAKEGGCNLTVGDEPADIEGGFILSYGGIEENCSLKALFREKKDRLTDAVSGVLFG